MCRASFSLLAAIAFLVPGSASAQQAKPDSAASEFFEKKIRPLLIQNCFECHSTGKKRKGELHLDSRAAILKGGDNGPAIVPGSPGKSLLIKAIGYKDELRMPPRSRLSDEQIADLTAWVKMGAPWPGGDKPVTASEKFDFEKRRQHWSYQPVKPARPPVVKNLDWTRTPIDRFVLARLEAKKLKPATEADRRTLLRRLTFDLTGLPPTAGEIAGFLVDTSPAAYEKVVDRLLSSPAYGERWGRHWLDLMRFAETHGHEFDFEIPNAHKYRDAVVRAFNDDVPYDRLVREHLAGDLLRDPRREASARTNDSILMTGFWFLGEGKHSPVDLRVDGGDRRDNTIDVFGKAFLGTTISCARCHDHKFDPIYTKDYYGLVSVLQSSRLQQAFLDHPERISLPAKKVRELRAEAATAERKLSADRLKAAFVGLEKGLLDSQKDDKSPVAQALGHRAARSTRDPFIVWRTLSDPSLKTPAAWEQKRKELLGQRQTSAKQAEAKSKEWTRFSDFSDLRDWFVTGDSFGGSINGIRPAAVATRRGQGAMRSKTFTIAKKFVLYRVKGQNVRVNLIIDGFQLIQDPIYGGLRFGINAPQTRWQAQNVSMWVGQKAYVEVLDDGDGWCEIEEVCFSDNPNPSPSKPNALFTALVAESKSLDDLAKNYARLFRESAELYGAGKVHGGDRADLVERLLESVVLRQIGESFAETAKERDRIKRLLDEADRLEATLPQPNRGLAMTDGDGHNDHVHLRGNPKMLGEEAPRRLPVILGGEKQAKPTGSGRLDLANRLASRDNPLFARVMVNRLWHHHFGTGLVASVDDFGHQGEKPTHPELLDWLAEEFARSGWTIKGMHRLILLSATYRQSSRSDEASEQADPKNELLHRMPIRRLEAEAVRDSMLAVSGRLDRTMFGRGPLPHLSEFMIGRGRPASGPLDGLGRRSLYLNVRRNFLNPMFLAFDYPVPFTAIGRRSVSNVPAQALTLLNNPFVIQQAKLWADRVLGMPGDDEGRIQMMYESAFGRRATEEELRETKGFLVEQGKEYGKADARAWADLAHVLFNVKEFIFVN